MAPHSLVAPLKEGLADIYIYIYNNNDNNNFDYNYNNKCYYNAYNKRNDTSQIRNFENQEKSIVSRKESQDRHVLMPQQLF